MVVIGKKNGKGLTFFSERIKITIINSDPVLHANFHRWKTGEDKSANFQLRPCMFL